MSEPFSPPIDEMMMIEPSLRSRICGAHIAISQWFEMTLFCRILVKASSEMPAIGPK